MTASGIDEPSVARMGRATDLGFTRDRRSQRPYRHGAGARSRRSDQAAIRKYDIAPVHQHRVAARPIVCGRIRPPARPSRHSDLGRKNRRFQPAARVSWGHHCGSLAPRRKTGAISLLHYPGHDPAVFTCAVREICWRTGSRVMLAHEPAVSRKNRSAQQERESHVGVSCSPLSDSEAETR